MNNTSLALAGLSLLAGLLWLSHAMIPQVQAGGTYQDPMIIERADSTIESSDPCIMRPSGSDRRYVLPSSGIICRDKREADMRMPIVPTMSRAMLAEINGELISRLATVKQKLDACEGKK